MDLQVDISALGKLLHLILGIATNGVVVELEFGRLVDAFREIFQQPGFLWELCRYISGRIVSMQVMEFGVGAIILHS